jgi:ankyrin repeat protein
MNRRQRVCCVGVMLMCATVLTVGAGSDVADAVMKGDAAAVRKLLIGKADVNAPQVDGATALHWAVYRDDVELADMLLKAGANVKAANREGTTPLFMAALYGDPAMIERLLKAGADPKQRGPNGETTLMFAARNGNPAAIKLLVAAGADVNAKEGIRATTALMWAAEEGHAAAAKTLIELGADVSAKSGPAGLPRNYMSQAVNVDQVEAAARRRKAAREAGRTYEEQLKFEAANGAVIPGRFGNATTAAENAAAGNPDAGQNFGQPPPAGGAARAGGQGGRAGAGRAGGRAAAGAGGAAGANAAGAAGGNAAARDGNGAAAPAPDAQAAQDANQDVIVAGLVGGGSGGLTPLVFTAREGSLETAKTLVEAGADVNQATEYGWTPLLVATNNRNYKLGAFLLEHGADPNIANKGGWTPLYLATDNRNIEGGDYPVPKPDMDHLEFIKLLLNKGADPNMQVKENTLSRTIFTMQWFFEPGATAFVRAAQSSDTALMKLLLEHGADPKIATDFGDTALTAAGGIGWVEGVTYERSPKENLEAVRMLLDLGLDPNAANHDGRTPLMGAAHKGRNEVIQLLVERGAKLDTRDKGSRDTGNAASAIAGHRFQVLDYSEGLVRVGVQSAIPHPETAKLIRKMLADRGLPVPPENRNVDSICVVEICQ